MTTHPSADFLPSSPRLKNLRELLGPSRLDGMTEGTRIDIFRQMLPGVRRSLLSEAVARGQGYGSLAARRAMDDAAPLRHPDRQRPAMPFDPDVAADWLCGRTAVERSAVMAVFD